MVDRIFNLSTVFSTYVWELFISFVYRRYVSQTLWFFIDLRDVPLIVLNSTQSVRLKTINGLIYLRSCTFIKKRVSAALRAAETRFLRPRAKRADAKYEWCKI